MRIANVIEEGKVGGPQVRMVRVAAALKLRMDTIIVMPGANSGPFRDLCGENGVIYRVLPLTRITKEWRTAVSYCMFSPYEVISLARLFRRLEVNVVHASGGSWQYKAVVAARFAKIPVVWHLNDTAMPGWVRRLFRIVSPLADGFIFASYRSQEYYGGAVGTRPQVVIPAAVDSDQYNPTHCENAEEEKWVDSDDARTIGTVANINPIKGLETLIEALGALNTGERNVRLLIVGPVFENQKRYYRRLLELARTLSVSGQIDWVGAQSDVRHWLQRMDVYVCSSRAESSPVSVWEAMAMGRPLVSTDVGDVPHHVVKGESGFIVPVDDSEAIADRVGALLDDEGLRRGVGERAREVAVENFSVEKVAEATGDFYEEVLQYWRSGRGIGTSGERKEIE